MDSLERQQPSSLEDEWVGACGAGNPNNVTPSKRTFTPADRGIRYVERAKRKEGQVSEVKKVTELVIGSSMKSDHNEAKNFEDDNFQAHVFNCTMPSSPQLDKHHRVVVELSNSQSSLSLDSGLGTETLQAQIRKKLYSLDKS